MKKGFTLIEIIVSLAIFTVVAVVAVGAFLKIIDANKKSQTLQTAMNNVNFALESMVREIRVGSTYYCYSDSGSIILTPPITAQSCGLNSSYNAIAFKSSDIGHPLGNPLLSCNLVHAYRYNDSVGFKYLEKAVQTNCDDPIGDPVKAPFYELTAADLNIDRFALKVDSVPTTPLYQPKVFILITGHSGTGKNASYFTLQTSASQRIMN